MGFTVAGHQLVQRTAQRDFDERLQALGLFDFGGFGPPIVSFTETLTRHGWRVDGFQLIRASPSEGAPPANAEPDH